MEDSRGVWMSKKDQWLFETLLEFINGSVSRKEVAMLLFSATYPDCREAYQYDRFCFC